MENNFSITDNFLPEQDLVLLGIVLLEEKISMTDLNGNLIHI